MICTTLLAVILAAASAHAQPLPKLAYLGCFKKSDLATVQNQTQQLAPGSLGRCHDICHYMGQPLAAVASDFSCNCFGTIPDAAAVLSKEACSSQAPGIAAAVFYVHKGACTCSTLHTTCHMLTLRHHHCCLLLLPVTPCPHRG